MSIDRRTFIKRGAVAGTLAAVSTPSFPFHALGAQRKPLDAPPMEDPRVRAFAMRALDSARSAGASYADVRLTHSWQRDISPSGVADVEMMSVGVRAFVKGYWGFASGPIWSDEEMVRLGREAFEQANANTVGKARQADLAPAPKVTGTWTMPVKLDPFEISPLEIIDYLQSLAIFAQRTPHVGIMGNSAQFIKHESAFASTVESYCVQRKYRSSGAFVLQLIENRKQMIEGLDCLTPAGMGWELYQDQPMYDRITERIASMREDLKLPVIPVDVGRYDAVFDAQSVCSLLHDTLVIATELDRALGYEANATGTSYLNDPLAMLRNYKMGVETLGVTCNRSEAGGCATTQWDDEGIVPDTFTVVDQGILTDFQTTREGAGWLKDYYRQQGTPVRSHGCATALMGIYAPLSRVPNAVMTPGKEALDFDDLIKGMTKGVAVRTAGIDMDFQALNGFAGGRVYEVKNGKRTSVINAAAALFRTPELWKGILGMGGAASARRFGMSSSKGEPPQEHYTSMTAVPTVFKQLSLIDALRKA